MIADPVWARTFVAVFPPIFVALRAFISIGVTPRELPLEPLYLGAAVVPVV